MLMVGIGIAETARFALAVHPAIETRTLKVDVVVNEVLTIAPVPVMGAEPDQV
jgi:hypothetical protein